MRLLAVEKAVDEILQDNFRINDQRKLIHKAHTSTPTHANNHNDNIQRRIMAQRMAQDNE